MPRFALVFPVLFVLVVAIFAQAPPPQKISSAAVIPDEAAKEPNPVKATPESIERAKKWWNMDCATCHGKTGDGKGETAVETKLTIPDFTDPAALKDRTDGELFYIIKNGRESMPAEGQRIKTEEGWDLVNYVRSLVKTKPASNQKPQAEQKSR